MITVAAMASDATQKQETVLLYDIPWSTYQGIIDALPEQRFRHTYAHGTLEILQPLVYDVPRESYEAILTAFGDKRFRHTYIDGCLEIMSPSERHEWVKEFIGHVIALAALELEIPIKSVGSTTRRHPGLPRGLEPDLSYYVQHEAEVRGRTSDDQPVPPPDLMVEVEITHRVLERLEAFATLEVPEVWRYRDDEIRFFRFEENAYVEIERSVALPQLACADITRCLDRLDTDDENSILRDLLKTLRERNSSDTNESR